MLAARLSNHLFCCSAEGRWVSHPIGGGEELVHDSLDFRCPVSVAYEDAELG